MSSYTITNTGSAEENEEEGTARTLYWDEALEIMRPDEQRRLQSNSRSSCFACKHQHCNDPIKFPVLTKFFKMFFEQIATTSQEVLFKEMEKFYIDNIYTPMLESGMEPERFNAKQIKTHFMNHVHSPSLIVWRQIKRLQKVESMLLNNIAKHSSQGEPISVSLKVVSVLLETQSQICKKLQLKTSKMLGHSEMTQIFE